MATNNKKKKHQKKKMNPLNQKKSKEADEKLKEAEEAEAKIELWQTKDIITLLFKFGIDHNFRNNENLNIFDLSKLVSQDFYNFVNNQKNKYLDLRNSQRILRMSLQNTTLSRR